MGSDHIWGRFSGSPFLLTAANRGDYKAWLVSDVVPEQPGDGTLEFR